MKIETELESKKGDLVKLLKKLQKITEEFKNVEASGFNSYSRYSYSTEEDILRILRPACEKHSVFINVTVVSQDVSNFTREKTERGTQIRESYSRALVVMAFDYYCCETGEKLTSKCSGYAEDKGDKALAQAITHCVKSEYGKQFKRNTGDDPDVKTPGGVETGEPSLKFTKYSDLKSSEISQIRNYLVKNKELAELLKVARDQKPDYSESYIYDVIYQLKTYAYKELIEYVRNDIAKN